MPNRWNLYNLYFEYNDPEMLKLGASCATAGRVVAQLHTG